MSETARAPYQMSMPLLRAICVSASTSPGPPPTASTVRPPQNLNRPAMLNACRPQAAVKRTPFERIHCTAGRLSFTRSSVRSGSQRYSVTRAMSSRNCSAV